MSRLARTERASLCDLFDRLGPDEPTLCEGWRTRDLAAHLVLREGRLDAAPGIVVPFMAGRTQRVQQSLASSDFRRLVQRLRSGPPAWSPFRPAPVDEAANGIEFFIHHEDVRRAQPEWEARALGPTTEELFWKRACRMARIALRNDDVTELRRTDTGARHAIGSDAPAGAAVTLSGLPSELLLYLFGRREHARVERS